MEDGLCDSCADRRRLITYIHRYFPETNPEHDYDGKEENQGFILELWKENPITYPTVEKLLAKFDPLFQHPLRNEEELKTKVGKALSDLTDLEKHFRLQLAYLARGRAIYSDFAKTLGRDCVRVTHDSKNPLVIGLGDAESAITTQQKRVLGICACVGTMVEYADDNRENKAPCRAYAVNLSSNTDKTS